MIPTLPHWSFLNTFKQSDWINPSKRDIITLPLSKSASPVTSPSALKRECEEYDVEASRRSLHVANHRTDDMRKAECSRQ
jgi:hypothetical protein